MPTREELRARWLAKMAGATVDHVEQTEAALAALPSAVAERASREQDRRTIATDSRYWVAICFQTREQKDEFLSKTGLDAVSDGTYVDGQGAAAMLDIELTSPAPEWKEAPVKKRLADLA